jgi:DNA-binding NtrC family response regulator
MSLQNLKARLAEDEKGVKAAPVAKAVILAVDDDDAMRESLDVVFGRLYQVRSCSNGKDALAALTADVRAVILDVRMPGEDGFQVYEALRKANEIVPIIFYSAYQDLKDPYKIMNTYRPFGYVFKGADPDELMKLVAAAVKHCEWLVRLQQQHEEIRGMLGKMGS